MTGPLNHLRCSRLLRAGDQEDQRFSRYLKEVAIGSMLANTSGYVQHGNTSCLLHSIAVAYYSFSFALFFRFAFRERELIRGALLHDYFLYDWHRPKTGHTLHAFTHARDAMFNAEKEFSLTKTERNVIRRHMFPLTPIPPLCREAFLVSFIDKGCSLYETFRPNAYTRLRRQFLAMPELRGGMGLDVITL